MVRTTVLVLLLSVIAVDAALLVGTRPAAVIQAQTTPYPVVLTMTGPATATSGQEVTYIVHYRLTDLLARSQTGFRIRIPRHTTFVSTQVVAGPPGVLAHQDENDVVWGGLGQADAPEGDVELVVRIDGGFVGSIFADAYVPGTETTQSNAVETEVFAAGTFPDAGGGSAEGDSGVPPVAALVGLLGAALIAAGAASRRLGRER